MKTQRDALHSKQICSIA